MYRAMIAAAVLSAASPAFAAQSSTAPASSSAQLSSSAQAAALAAKEAAFIRGLNKQTGAISLPEAAAVLNLGDRYYFLDAADSRKILVDLWRNPPEAAEGVLGMVFAKGASPFDPAAWGAVVTFQDVGYVADADARKTDNDKLLKQLREGEDDDNRQRKEKGFDAIHLAGWAQPPLYDAAAHTLIWARDLKSDRLPNDTLNYDIRVLGRKGVLSLNMVAGMDQLSAVNTAARDLRQTAGFVQGSRYADYKSGVDKKAAFGIGGLILAGAGVVAAKKLGLLAVAFLFFKKGSVVIAAAAAGAFGWIKRKLGMKSKTGGDPGPGSGAA